MTTNKAIAESMDVASIGGVTQPATETTDNTEFSETECIRLLCALAVAAASCAGIYAVKHAVFDTGSMGATAGITAFVLLLFAYFGGLLAIGDMWPRARWFIVAGGAIVLGLLSWHWLAILAPGFGSDEDSSAASDSSLSADGDSSHSSDLTDRSSRSSDYVSLDLSYSPTDTTPQPLPAVPCGRCGQPSTSGEPICSDCSATDLLRHRYGFLNIF